MLAAGVGIMIHRGIASGEMSVLKRIRPPSLLMQATLIKYGEPCKQMEKARAQEERKEGLMGGERGYENMIKVHCVCEGK